MRFMMLTIALSCAGSGWAVETTPAQAEPQDTHAAAKKTFKATCVLCHGADARGNKSMAKMFNVKVEVLDLAQGDAVKKTEVELAKIIAEGKGKMPNFKSKLDKENIQGLVRYLVSLRPVKPKSESPAKSEVKTETKADTSK